MKKSILKVVHDSVKNMHKAGLIDKHTMHELDALCVPKIMNALDEHQLESIVQKRLTDNQKSIKVNIDDL